MIKITKKKVRALLPIFLYGDRGIQFISILAVFNREDVGNIRIG